MKWLSTFILLLNLFSAKAQLLSLDRCFSGTRDEGYVESAPYFADQANFKRSENDSFRYFMLFSNSNNNFFDTIDRHLFPYDSTGNWLIRLNENTRETNKIFIGADAVLTARHDNVLGRFDNDMGFLAYETAPNGKTYYYASIITYDLSYKQSRILIDSTGSGQYMRGPFMIKTDSFYNLYCYKINGSTFKMNLYKINATGLASTTDITTMRLRDASTDYQNRFIQNNKIYEFMDSIFTIYDAEAHPLHSYQVTTNRMYYNFLQFSAPDSNTVFLQTYTTRGSLTIAKIQHDSLEYALDFYDNTKFVVLTTNLIDTDRLIPFSDDDSTYFIRYDRNGNPVHRYAEKGISSEILGNIRYNDSTKIIIKNKGTSLSFIQKINLDGVPLLSTQITPTLIVNSTFVNSIYSKVIKTRQNRFFVISYYETAIVHLPYYYTIHEYYPQNGNLTLLNVSAADNNYNLFYKEIYSNSRNETYILSNEMNGCIRNYDMLLYKLANGWNTVKGKIFIDYNNNNTQDGGEPYYENGKISYTKNGNTFSAYLIDTGNYSFVIDTGKYVVDFKMTDSLFTVTPLNKTVTHATYNNTDFVNFILKPIGVVYDAEIMMNNTFVTRPGFTGTYAISYTNKGNYVLSGFTVKVLPDHRLVIDSSSVLYTVNNDTLQWAITQILQPGETRTILLHFTAMAPPDLNNGEALQSIAFIDIPQHDTNTANNQFIFNEFTRGSYDPNEKMVSDDALTDSEIASNTSLFYTIRFENTGTDTAFNITVKDTLPDNVNLNSFQPVTSSAPYTLQVSNNSILSFYFKNIKLPPSSVNPLKAHGYVTYKIRPVINSSGQNYDIKNTAHIIFDYNLPVSTNTATTNVQVTTTVSTNKDLHDKILIYPNPSGDLVNIRLRDISTDNMQMKLADVAGNILLSKKITAPDFSVNIHSMAAGTYLLIFENLEDKFIAKVIITH